MKKPHINVVHYMSKTANLGYSGELQALLVEFVLAVISVTLTVYGYVTDWDLLIPIFIVPAVLCSILFIFSAQMIVSNYIDDKRRREGNDAS